MHDREKSDRLVVPPVPLNKPGQRGRRWGREGACPGNAAGENRSPGGDVWWSWDERSGARSNQDDPSVGCGVGEEISLMVDPTPLLEVKVLQSGRLLARLRLAGVCNSFACAMRTIEVELP